MELLQIKKSKPETDLINELLETTDAKEISLHLMLQMELFIRYGEMSKIDIANHASLNMKLSSFFYQLEKSHSNELKTISSLKELEVN